MVSFLSFSKISGESDAYQVGLENIHYLPYYFAHNDKDGVKFEGVIGEIFREFSLKSKTRLEYRPLPIKRLYSSLIDKSIDFKFPDNPVWGKSYKKDVDVLYSLPIASFVDGILVKYDSNISLDELRRIGIVRGFTPYEYLDLIHDNKISVTEAGELSSLLKMLDKGRIQGIYANVAVCQKVAKEVGVSIIFNSNLPHNKSFYYLSTINEKVVIERFNQFLNEHREKINEIKLKYGLEP